MTIVSGLFVNTTLAPVASLDPWGNAIDPGLTANDFLII